MARGGRRRLALLWSCLVLPRLASCQPFLACSISCCVFRPDCSGATSMLCDCPNADQLTLRANNIPPTVEYIQINNTPRIRIARNAIYRLHSVRELSVQDARQLEVDNDGLAVAPSAGIQQLRVERVREVVLNSDALSGTWPAGAEITLHRIDRLRLERLALHMDSPGRGPRVRLEHVTALSAQKDAFRATISQLLLVNVSLNVCRPHTFTGAIDVLDVLGCRISSMETDCVRPRGRSAAVSLRSSSVLDVQRRAIVGSVAQLLLEAVNITTLHEGALQVRADSLELKGVHVHEWRRHALNVTVSGSIMIRDSRVDVLHGGALAALRLAAGRRGQLKPFSLHSVHVGRAESGALRTDARVRAVDVSWDSLMLDAACSCRLGALVRDMVAGADAQLTGRQRQFVALVRSISHCSQHGRPTPLADSLAACPSVDRGDDGGDADGTSLDQSIVFYGVIAGVSLLAVVGASVLLASRRRLCGGDGRGDSGGDSRHSGSRRDSGGGGRRRRSRPPPSTASLLGRAGAHSTATTKTELGSTGRLPDLLRSAPVGAPVEHIYAEIRPPPPLAEYAEPRDVRPSAATPDQAVYAEIAPLAAGQAAPAPPPPLADNALYGTGTGSRHVSVTDL